MASSIASTVPADILLTIVQTNSSLFNRPPAESLPELRRSSQVCKSWRSCILQSPLLWAYCIDLDSLKTVKLKGSERQDSDDAESDDEDLYEDEEMHNPQSLARTDDQDSQKALWIKEVIRRSKGLPLWMRGSRISTKPIALIALDILEAEWGRVEQVVIDFWSGAEFSSVDSTRWSKILSRPAPRMDNYGIRFFFGSGDHDYTPYFLSENNAPSLTQLSVINYGIDTGACWAANLRDLHLGTFDTVLKILQALTLMPMLETLSVDSLQRHEALEPDHMYPRIQFKHLKSLAITMAISTSSKMLECITPPTGCSVSVTARSMRPTAIREGAMLPFSNYAKNLIHTYTLKDAKLQLNESLGFSAYTLDTKGPYFHFYIGAFHPGRRHHSDTIGAFTKAFMFKELSCATEFELSFGHSGANGARLMRHFTPFLDNIKIIRMDESSLTRFYDAFTTNANDEVPAPFPNLDTLRLSRFEFESAKKVDASVKFNGVLSVLQFLRDAGRPIKVLDLTLCPGPINPSFELDAIEKLSGLKIIWFKEQKSAKTEYICGSGRPAEIVQWRD